MTGSRHKYHGYVNGAFGILSETARPPCDGAVISNTPPWYLSASCDLARIPFPVPLLCVCRRQGLIPYLYLAILDWCSLDELDAFQTLEIEIPPIDYAFDYGLGHSRESGGGGS